MPHQMVGLLSHRVGSVLEVGLDEDGLCSLYEFKASSRKSKSSSNKKPRKRTKKFFFPYGSFSIKDGSEIRFWKYKWLGNATHRE
jgi:hypothetical protein